MTEQSIIQDNAYLFGFLEDVRNSFPDAGPVKLERVAICDALGDVTMRLERLRFFIESIEWLMSDYIKCLGVDVPPTIEHLSFDLAHLADDCKRLSKDAYSVLGVTGQLVREPRVG